MLSEKIRRHAKKGGPCFKVYVEDWGTSNISTSGKNNKKTINNTYEKMKEQVLNN